MFARISPPLFAFGGSILLFVGLVGALYWTNQSTRRDGTGEPLIIYCAEAMRAPMEAIAREYEKDLNQEVRLHFGTSQTILANLELAQKGDLFLPADESFVRLAKKKGLIRDADVFNLARMHAVVIVRPDFPGKIATWDDFIAPGHKIGLANVEAAAVSKILKQELQSIGLWDALEKRKPANLGDVNKAASSVHLGAADVSVVWDVIARQYPRLTVVKLKELDNVQGRVQIALAKCSKNPDDALRFVRYLRAVDKGAPHLKKLGYSNVDEGEASDRRPELVVYAGSMLRPALERSLNDFEKREGVRITRVYNGCGILVGAMETGETPDVYFACDTRFMTQVRDKFTAPANVSNNLLVIAVKKGNPKNIRKLEDLAQPKLRLGVGHESQCALGTLTKETFLKTGVYARVKENIKVESPTGDYLVNQLRVGALDVVVAYKSNVLPFADELEAISITELFPDLKLECANPQQPIAISKNTTHPEISRRLMEFLRTEESRQRFEKLGFGWEVREVESK